MLSWHVISSHALQNSNCKQDSERNGWCASDGRFSFSQIFDYLRSGSYPDGFEKNDKRALRKRASFFVVKDTKLYYTGGKYVASYIDPAINATVREGEF